MASPVNNNALPRDDPNRQRFSCDAFLLQQEQQKIFFLDTVNKEQNMDLIYSKAGMIVTRKDSVMAKLLKAGSNEFTLQILVT